MSDNTPKTSPGLPTPLALALAKDKRANLVEAAAEGLRKSLDPPYHTTLEDVKPVSKETLEKRLTRRLELIQDYLTPERLLAKLDEAKLKDMGVYEGIMLTKLAELRTTPTIIINSQDSTRLDDLAKALVAEIANRKGTTLSLTERKAVIGLDGPVPDPPSPPEQPGVQGGPDARHPGSGE